MITSEIKDELRRIQAELKKPFPANLHEVRELPGSSKKWVFLRWQTIRERLDEIAPDWMSDYSEIQYIGNDAICRCGIAILGVRKEAIASVPISLQSKAGNEMTRGSAADRLAAEGLKNAAECWGVGRYLDDQPFTISYLWERMSELDDAMCGQVRLLSEQYKLRLKAAAVEPDIKKSPELLSKPVRHNLLPQASQQPKQQQLPARKEVTKPSVVHPQDSRVRQIREIFNYPRDLVVEWLQFQDADRPSQLEPKIVNELVKTICLTWAADKFEHSNHAANSYQKHIVDAVANGADEVAAIQGWINHIANQKVEATIK
ncbi:hypothetical protein LC607_17700 [Nostoc sp. CHAB 5824]|nr:hypothetical protein [Nostoc sp. CHAB 5824]